MSDVNPAPLHARQELALSGGVLMLAIAMAAGAWTIPSDAGYAGVGPDFLPWVVSLVLMVCSGFLFWEVYTGGFRNLEEGNDGAPPFWAGFFWMSAGLLMNAALITTIGFILSCALCFTLAARGGRLAQGQGSGGLAGLAQDGMIGALIAAPVYWLFTKFLAINLPGLTASGWL